ncbi:hypothetical protein GCM10020218_103710 [Dactylosporangium vinaceum]
MVTLGPCSDPLTVEGAGSRPARLIIGAWLAASWLGPTVRTGGVTVDQNWQAARPAPGPVPPVGLVGGVGLGEAVRLGLAAGEALLDGDGLAGGGVEVGGGVVVGPPPAPEVRTKSSA